MNTANNHPDSEREASPLIDKLRRQMAASDGDDVAGSTRQAEENTHWSLNYASRPYVGADEAYLDYAPAYLYGVVWYDSSPERQFEDCERDLANGWDSVRGGSPLDWPKAKPAVRDAWYRVSDLAAQARLERSELLSTSPAGPSPGDH
jgi:hypothetical protein